jgi:zinc protease
MNSPHKPEELKLSNGIPVILQHFDGPVGTFHWWNLTGSTDESPEEAGFAHFLEHMLFKDAGAKDTGQASTGQTARIIESLGGEINAYTTFDQTVYHVTASEQYWEEVMDQFGIMAKPQKFLKSDFEREREVIIEELRRGQDSPDRQLYEKLFSLTYSKHPYGRPVIGYEKVLKAATVQKLEKFYKRQYVSSQMGLVLVGPIYDSKGLRKKKILSVLEKRFGIKTILKRPLAKRVRPTETALSAKPRFKNAFFDVKTPELAISFRVPDLLHHDIPQLEVTAGVLGMGESSRLYQKLFYDQSMVTDISSSLYVPRDPGMFLLSAELKQSSDLNAVMDTLLDEIRILQTEGPNKEEMERVISNLESEKLYSTQTVDGLAGRLGFLKYSLGDLNFDHTYLEQLKQATPRTVRQIASHYLVPNRMNTVFLQPKAETAISFDSVQKSTSKIIPVTHSVAQLKQKSKASGNSIQPTLITTSSGLKVAYLERQGNAVFSLYFSSFGGTRFEITEDTTLWGSSHLLAQTWTKGTPSIQARDISKLIEGCAASFDGFSGRNTIGLQMTGLIRDWDRLSSLFADVLFNPLFADDELAHSKRITLDSIQSIPNHSSQVCSKLFMENLFEHHPYGHHPLGTEAQVESLKSSHLKQIHEQWVRAEQSSFSIVGGIPAEDMMEFVELLDQKLNERKKNQSKYTLPTLAGELALKAPRWAHANFDREQTHIMMGGLGLSMFDPRRYPLRLLQNILGGQSGRLFIELREKKSMAYSVSPISMEGLEPGYFGTYIACSPSKKDDAIAGMIQVVETLAKKGPTAAEMKRAKNYYLGQRSMDLQSTWALAASYGLELLYRSNVLLEPEIKKSIEKVTAKDIQKVANQLFVDPPKLTVVVG